MDMKQTLAEHGLAGLSGQESRASITFETLLEVSDRLIQGILRECDSKTLTHALCGDDVAAIRAKTINSISKVAAEQLVRDMASASPSAYETETARATMLQLLEVELASQEQQQWQSLTEDLSPEVFRQQPDLTLLNGLSPEQLKSVLDEARLALYTPVFASSSEWYALFDRTKALLSERAVELLIEDIAFEQWDYPWIPELGKRELTYLGTLLVEGLEAFDAEKQRKAMLAAERAKEKNEAWEKMMARYNKRKQDRDDDQPKGLLQRLGSWFK